MFGSSRKVGRGQFVRMGIAGGGFAEGNITWKHCRQ